MFFLRFQNLAAGKATAVGLPLNLAFAEGSTVRFKTFYSSLNIILITFVFIAILSALICDFSPYLCCVNFGSEDYGR